MKTSIKLLTIILLSLFFYSCSGNNSEQATKKQEYTWKTAKSGDYEYKYIENDPSNTRFYTLENGLTVILSPSKKEPRIQTFIATKAGSKTDPASHTGLAHYLEHMLFKGTDKFGSLDWEKEKPLLDEIEALYEEYNSTTDTEARKRIYREIDRVSGEAAKYAIANEYDKMMAGMGAQGTNAFTSFEQTVYTEDIPSNVIDKYLTVQAERFRNPVFRLFHTELEAVYEEKNRSLDSDDEKMFDEMFAKLFPNNNYGKQTTIGEIEHLKNPSLKEIRKYYENYYVPNNMGIVMAGDFDPDMVIKNIDERFNYMEPKEVPAYVVELEEDIQEPIESEVFGPESEQIILGYRFPGADSEDSKMLELIGEILTNGSAGMIDLNLVQKQKLLGAYAFPYVLKDYSALILLGMPTVGQSLEDVRDLMLQEIEKLKKGDFSEELLSSIINNARKEMMEVNESYRDRAYYLMDNFVLGTDWKNTVTAADWISTVTKEDIVEFANRYLKMNYVAVYKRKGEDTDIVKVEKPEITPVDVNRENQSEFLQMIAEMPENEIAPLWINYEEDIDKTADKNYYEVLSVKNTDNELFDLTYYYPTGSWGNKLLKIAAGYLDYIGTEEKSAEDISVEFYNLASSFSIWVGEEDTRITMDGLQENFDKTISLFDDLLKNCVADDEAFEAYIDRIKKSRYNAKDNKYSILQGLRSYAMYGPENPYNSVLSMEELDSLKAEDIIEVLHDLASYNHKVLYYGPRSSKDIAKTLKGIHPMPKEFVEIPETVRFKQQDQEENEVYLAHFDMVQAEVFWVRNNNPYTEQDVPIISFFNQYFGGGMESVVFQTIRESKALAYSTYAYYQNPSQENRRTSFMAYVGAQADKFNEAVQGMNELLTDLPRSDKSVQNAINSQRKKLATDRITGIDVLYNYMTAQKMGRNHDIRKDIYNTVPNFTFDDLNEFHKDHISEQPYAYCIVAGEGKIQAQYLNAIGKVKTLSLEEVFGY